MDGAGGGVGGDLAADGWLEVVVEELVVARCG